jgi:hypothetical protein
MVALSTVEVTLFEHPNFTGRSRAVGIGEHRLEGSELHEAVSSIQVPPGVVACVYERVDDDGFPYGLWCDFLENCSDLTTLSLNDKISYVTVFLELSPTEPVMWRRTHVENGQVIPGMWERLRARVPNPANPPVPVVAPPIPPRGIVQPDITYGGTPALPASASVQNVTIETFTRFRDAQPLWDAAVNDQMGILGSDFRGVEEIGSAAFERASHHPIIPDYVNFWYPQRQPRDQRSIVYFKRTLSGRIKGSHVANIEPTFPDHDLNIHIDPDPNFRYLVTDAHPREYTDIMRIQWEADGSGKPNCDDPESIAESVLVEAEIYNDPAILSYLPTVFNGAIGRQVCVYGPWIYDRGHCCHSEIHPAEQIWWSDPYPTGTSYFCNLFCDESERFWWRDQMDDGTKLKPWGAPPIRGIFAIAFEAQVNSPAKEFEIHVHDAYNHMTPRRASRDTISSIAEQCSSPFIRIPAHT